jgi:hypothetical protein
MGDAYDHELRLALDEGFLTPEEAAELMSKAGQRLRAPLDLLVEAGRISREKANALRERALTISSAPTAPSATVSSLEANSTVPSDAGRPTRARPPKFRNLPIRDWDRPPPFACWEREAWERCSSRPTNDWASGGVEVCPHRERPSGRATGRSKPGRRHA